MPIVASAGLMKSSTPSGRKMLYCAKSRSMQANEHHAKGGQSVARRREFDADRGREDGDERDEPETGQCRATLERSDVP
jgi:hypothetical protein